MVGAAGFDELFPWDLLDGRVQLTRLANHKGGVDVCC
jgi:hypothetical protein